MDRSVKQPSNSELSEWKEFIAAGVAIGLGEAAGMSIRVGESLYADTQQDVSWNPLIMAINLGTGDLDWTGAATGGAVTLAAGTVVAAAGSVWAWRATCRKCSKLYAQRGRIKREAIDKQARWMAKGKELTDLRRAAIAAKAADLMVQLRDGDAPGVLIGRTVVDGVDLYGSFEDLHVDIWGPRSGKSTSRVIPAVMEAPGAVVATSNKRDVVDATRQARSAEGAQVFVFDPQGVAEEPCTWYWDPIAWVLGEDGGAGAQRRSAQLAGHFAAAGEADKRDAFFDPEGENLLAGLFLACAVDKRPITQAFRWVTTSHDNAPVAILRAHDYVETASALSAQYNAAPKQRDGIFGTAKKMAACLQYRDIHPWVCPPIKGEETRAAFTVEAFVRSRDTLYPLSKEEQGSAAPLVTAMCAAVNDAASREATRHRRGRLPVPLLMVLDEAANIVRWADLPKLYSHFGSRGIVVMTVLQSWAQGVRCWGHDGMTALWGAANIKVLGGGVDDESFLRARSELIGHHYELANSVSRSHGHGQSGSRSVSTSRTTEVTLHASDLASLPKGRMVVFTSGHRATLCQAVPWMARPYAAQIAAAIAEIERGQLLDTPTGRPVLQSVPTGADLDEEGRRA